MSKNYKARHQQDKVLNGPREIKVIKIAQSERNNQLAGMKIEKKLLQKFSHALLPQCITK